MKLWADFLKLLEKISIPAKYHGSVFIFMLNLIFVVFAAVFVTIYGIKDGVSNLNKKVDGLESINEKTYVKLEVSMQEYIKEQNQKLVFDAMRVAHEMQVNFGQSMSEILNYVELQHEGTRDLLKSVIESRTGAVNRSVDSLKLKRSYEIGVKPKN